MSFNLRTGVGKEFNLRTGLSGFQDITAEEISTGIIGAERLPEITKSKVSNAGQWEPSEIPALSSDTITSGTLNPDRIPDLDASTLTSGTLDAARIPNLDASTLTSGTLDPARIPNLDASKITTGTLGASHIPNLDASKITTGTLDSSRVGAGFYPLWGSGSSHALRFDASDVILKSTMPHSSHAGQPNTNLTEGGSSSLFDSIFSDPTGYMVILHIPIGYHPSRIVVSQMVPTSPLTASGLPQMTFYEEQNQVVKVGYGHIILDTFTVANVAPPSNNIGAYPPQVFNKLLTLTSTVYNGLGAFIDRKLLLYISPLVGGTYHPSYDGGYVVIEKI